MTLFSQSETEASGPVVYTVVFWTLALKSMFVCVEKCVCVCCVCARVPNEHLILRRGQPSLMLGMKPSWQYMQRDASSR